jgi:hypothetical protein
MYNTEEIKAIIKKEFQADVESNDPRVARQILIKKINELIHTDFQKLVTILYRVDVSERQLKKLLKENPGQDAAIIMADLLIERQLQKVKSREKFKKDDPSIPDDEKW